jgi:type I restriction enzyme R subunit
MNFSQQNLVEIKNHIAANIQGEIDIESARAFDYLCYKFATTKFNPNNDFKSVAKTIYALASYLVSFKGHIKEVEEHQDTLRYVMSNDFINNSSASKVDSVRNELRELMRYIDYIELKSIISDFDDEISSDVDAVEDEIDFSINVDDFKTLDEKVLFYIRNNLYIELIKQVRNIIKPTDEAIKQFKTEVINLATSAEEYNNHFKQDIDLIIFIRKNLEFNPEAVESFINEESLKGYNEIQLTYLKELLLFISQNGKFEINDLLREELDFKGIFNSEEINRLIEDIERRI